jgi:mRNA-degrading endonuclease RelE of RelBE toxin-antitoxin system
MFQVLFVDDSSEDLKHLRAFDRVRIIDKIEEQLAHEPAKPTRNRKLLVGVPNPWDSEKPVWEIRVEDHRVLYDVGLEDQIVRVRAIREKRPDQRTEDIL